VSQHVRARTPPTPHEATQAFYTITRPILSFLFTSPSTSSVVHNCWLTPLRLTAADKPEPKMSVNIPELVIMQSRKRGAAHTAVEVDYVIEAINKITPETPAEDMYGLMAAVKSELEAAKAGKAGKAEPPKLPKVECSASKTPTCSESLTAARFRLTKQALRSICSRKPLQNVHRCRSNERL
jgi:hypothetical protein